MSFQHILENCRSRIPWPAMRNILKQHRLPVGKGWDLTLQKLDSFAQESGRQRRRLNALEESYFEHLQSGNRTVKLFKLDDALSKAIIPRLQACTPPESLYLESFPYPLGDGQLAEMERGTILVSVQDNDDFINLVFCSKRFITERKELSVDLLSSEAKRAYGNVDSIIAVTSHTKQFFDVVTVWKNDGFVELRIDSDSLSSEDLNVAETSLKNAFNSICNLSGRRILRAPVNLFPLVDRIYEAQGEGTVCELGFTTDTASIKHERMRRKDICLRTETYHRAGKGAVHHITPYRLGVSWHLDLGEDLQSKPELLLPGSFRMLSEPDPFLSEAVITNCCGFSDFHFIIGKMKQYLP
jgi:hypothetical protein